MIIVTLGKNQMDDQRYSKESEEQRLEALAAAGRYVGFCVFPCVQCSCVPPNQFSQSQLLNKMTADITTSLKFSKYLSLFANLSDQCRRKIRSII